MDYVVVIGSLNYDIFFSVERAPRLGENIHALSSKSGCGGRGANQAVQIARLGAPVYMVGKTGADQAGETLRKSLQDAGVDLRYLDTVTDLESGMAAVSVYPDGNVSAVISRGANDAVSLKDLENVRELIRGAGLVVLQLEIPLNVVEEAIRMAKAYGVRVLLNAAPVAPLSEEVIRGCDYFVVNEVEGSFYMGETLDTIETAERLLPEVSRKYGNCWICTMGKEGALIANHDWCRRIPAVKTTVVETTGAGDSFVGGFCYAILQGKNEYDAGRFAAYCSAVTIRTVGAQNSMPDREQLRREFQVI